MCIFYGNGRRERSCPLEAFILYEREVLLKIYEYVCMPACVCAGMHICALVKL